jgi:DNA gyrase subunit A
MADDEHVVACKMIYEINPEHKVVYIFENGKGVTISMGVYETKSKRKKITGAYSTDSPLVGAVYIENKPKNIFIRSDAGRGMLIKSDLVPEKSTRTASGVQVMKLPRGKAKVDLVTDRIEDVGEDALKCKKLVLPSNGSLLSQLTFNF